MFYDFYYLIKRYSSLRDKIYVLVRWFIYPFYKMEHYLPESGIILDVGCGEGTFSIYCALKEKKRKVYGIDVDGRRIRVAKKASSDLDNTDFVIKDVLSWKKKVDAIILCDVFHHFKLKTQKIFLKTAYSLLNKNGRLIIKEINNKDFVRAKLSRLWDFILYPKDKINYWSREELTNNLQLLGFKVVSKREAIFFPGSTIFYICSKE